MDSVRKSGSISLLQTQNRKNHAGQRIGSTCLRHPRLDSRSLGLRGRGDELHDGPGVAPEKGREVRAREDGLQCPLQLQCRWQRSPATIRALSRREGGERAGGLGATAPLSCEAMLLAHALQLALAPGPLHGTPVPSFEDDPRLVPPSPYWDLCKPSLTADSTPGTREDAVVPWAQYQQDQRGEGPPAAAESQPRHAPYR